MPRDISYRHQPGVFLCPETAILLITLITVRLVTLNYSWCQKDRQWRWGTFSFPPRFTYNMNSGPTRQVRFSIWDLSLYSFTLNGPYKFHTGFHGHGLFPYHVWAFISCILFPLPYGTCPVVLLFFSKPVPSCPHQWPHEAMQVCRIELFPVIPSHLLFHMFLSFFPLPSSIAFFLCTSLSLTLSTLCLYLSLYLLFSFFISSPHFSLSRVVISEQLPVIDSGVCHSKADRMSGAAWKNQCAKSFCIAEGEEVYLAL